MVKVYATKGKLYGKDSDFNTYLCGSYFVSIPHNTAPSVMHFAMRKKLIEEKALLRGIDDMRKKFKEADSFFKGRKSKVALEKLLDSNYVAVGTGRTQDDAVFNLLDNVSFWLAFPPNKLESFMKEFPKNFSGNEKLEDLSIEEQYIYRILADRDETLLDISIPTIHSKEFYKKTYITLETLKQNPLLTDFSEERIMDAIIRLYNSGIVIFNDKEPKFFYSKEEKYLFKQYIVDTDMTPKIKIYF